MKRRLAVTAVVIAVALAIAFVTLPLWKPAAKRFKYFVVATNVYQDLLRRSGLRRDQISQPNYGALAETEVPAYLRRINSTFGDYQRYGGLDAERIHGRRVLEVGPGETIGVALRFLGAGAAHVTAVDKFVPMEQSVFHQRLYQQLAAGLPEPDRTRITSVVTFEHGVAVPADRLTYVYGKGMEEVAREMPPGSVDLIVSNAVLEEIYDTDEMFAGFDRLLKPGGRQVHVIDLGDYGMFSKHGFHPLEFLTIPDGVYRYMVESSGQPNRRPLQYYRGVAERYGYDSRIYRTWVVGSSAHLAEYPTSLEAGRHYGDANLQLIREIRPRLLPRYQQLPDDELLTRSILVVMDKRPR